MDVEAALVVVVVGVVVVGVEVVVVGGGDDQEPIRRSIARFDYLVPSLTLSPRASSLPFSLAPLPAFIQTLDKMGEMGGILPNDLKTAQMAAAAARKCEKDQSQQLRLVEVLTRVRAKAPAATTTAAVSK